MYGNLGVTHPVYRGQHQSPTAAIQVIWSQRSFTKYCGHGHYTFHILVIQTKDPPIAPKEKQSSGTDCAIYIPRSHVEGDNPI